MRFEFFPKGGEERRLRATLEASCILGLVAAGSLIGTPILQYINNRREKRLNNGAFNGGYNYEAFQADLEARYKEFQQALHDSEEKLAQVIELPLAHLECLPEQQEA